MKKGKLIWTIIRILGFVFIGIMNTVLLRPEDVGTWKNYAGYAFFALAIFDSICLYRQFKRRKI